MFSFEKIFLTDCLKYYISIMRSGKALFSALGLNFIFFLLYLAFGVVRHGSLDDYFMSSVLTGAYGAEYDVHMYFVNSAYGFFLKPFYLLFPKIGWYFIFELAGTFAAFTVYTYALIQNLGKKIGIPVAAVLLAALTPDFYFQLSFTQCATAYTAAGILLIALGDASQKKFHIILGGLFLIAGSVMRWEGFLLGLPLLCILLTSNIFERKGLYKGSLIILSITFVALFALKYHDKSLYSQGDYKYYAEYQPVRAFFGDGAYYDSESTFDELEEREMSGIDYQLAKSWVFYDTEILSEGELQKIIDVAKRNLYYPNWSRMPFAFLMAISSALTRTNGWCWVIFCILLIAIRDKKANLYPWASLCIVAASLSYLLLVNRLVYHVETGVWLYAIVGTIPFLTKDGLFQNEFVAKHKNIFPFAVILFAILFSALAISSQSLKTKWNIIETREMTRDWREFVDYVQQHPDDVFLLSFERYKQLGTLKDKPYWSIKPGSWQNIFSLGYWNIHLPAMKKELTKRGVTNPIKDIINPNVYLVEDSPYPILPDFYQRHYRRTLSTDTIATFGEIYVIKYSVVGDRQ